MYKNVPLPKEKQTNEAFYRRQAETLKLFLSKRAVTQAQYDKSCRDLTEKMRMTKPVGWQSAGPGGTVMNKKNQHMHGLPIEMAAGILSIGTAVGAATHNIEL